ncbi:hypothetical protein GCM10011613_27860 [Cellvibrio zantedeschiae]|uniref:Uncharacterized protein n=1 Tax=Cellvibrio zantedeschiae TaxID=1237077 RepID=A0ABQ3B9G6_9GAMM|nr:hypothetical protein GCM10011613_27860 [Cellvibrio zantedeschiae]
MGKGDRAVIALKQTHAQVIFKLLDIAAQGRRADMAGASSAAKVQAAGEGTEKFEFGDIHGGDRSALHKLQH